MKTFVLFLLRITVVCIFEWLTYYLAPAQASLFLTNQAKITFAPKSKMVCGSLTWLGDARVSLQDSSSLRIQDLVNGFDSTKRFFILGKDAFLIRNIDSLSNYTYPIGYESGQSNYRGFTLDMKSFGQTGAAIVSVKLVPGIQGGINYQKYFPSNDPSCLAGSSISFNCLYPDGWHCEGPDDYEYTVAACAPDYCGGDINRIIKTSTNSHNWQDSLESVMGDLGQSFCQYSQFSGGKYKSFSDFTIASSASVLPVTLLGLKAEAVNNSFIRVVWRTAIETNNEKFLVSRSDDGVLFNIVGEVVGHGTTTVPQDYVFNDMGVAPNREYYYRLEQIDFDGYVHLSPLVSARLDGDNASITKLFNVLGQEVSEGSSGILIIQKNTHQGSYASKIFKPLSP